MLESNNLKERILNQLTPDIQRINNVRRGVGNVGLFKGWHIVLIILAAICIDVFIAVINKFESPKGFGIVTILTIFALVYFCSKYAVKKLAPVKQLDDELREKMIKMINPNTSYEPEGFVNQQLFKRSGIFTEPGSRYYGENLIKGKLSNTNFVISEVCYESSNNDNTPVFYGMFMVAEFNKVFSGRTVVVRDIAESNLGNIVGSWVQKNNVGRVEELVKLENVEFEKRFAVYSTDQTEARYILTPAIMEKLVQLDIKYKGIYLSFVDNKIFMAFPRLRSGGLEIPYDEAVEPQHVWEAYEEMETLINNIETIINEFVLDNKILGYEGNIAEESFESSDIKYGEKELITTKGSFVKTIVIQVFLFAMMVVLGTWIFALNSWGSSDLLQANSSQVYDFKVKLFIIAFISIFISTIISAFAFTYGAVAYEKDIGKIGKLISIMPLLVTFISLPFLYLDTNNGIPFIISEVGITISVILIVLISLEKDISKIGGLLFAMSLIITLISFDYLKPDTNNEISFIIFEVGIAMFIILILITSFEKDIGKIGKLLSIAPLVGTTMLLSFIYSGTDHRIFWFAIIMLIILILLVSFILGRIAVPDFDKDTYNQMK